MAFVVEDGTGLTNANAYVGLEDFLTYWLERNKDYTDEEPEALQAAILSATDYVEIRYGDRFKGIRNSVEQALSWPRKSVYDRDGALIADDEVPVRLKKAIYEYAKRALTTELLPDPAVSSNIVKTSVTVGPIKEETQYSDGVQQTLRPYPMADRWLEELTRPVGGTMR